MESNAGYAQPHLNHSMRNACIWVAFGGARGRQPHSNERHGREDEPRKEERHRIPGLDAKQKAGNGRVAGFPEVSLPNTIEDTKLLRGK